MDDDQRLAGYQFKLNVCAFQVCVDCGSVEELEADHLIRKQTLRRYGQWDKRHDPRNAQPRCKACHHLRTVGKTRLDPVTLSADAWAFADETGLRWALERECETRVA